MQFYTEQNINCCLKTEKKKAESETRLFLDCLPCHDNHD